MKNTITLIFAFICFAATAQVTNQGKPASWKMKDIENPEPIIMPAFNLKALKDEDAANAGRKDIPWRYGYEFIVDYNLQNSGQWTDLPDGGRIWRARFKSAGARTMNFLFNDFYMPEGATLYLYNNERTDLLGAYDARQNNDERVLGTWLVKGEDIWIEYYEPAGVRGKGSLDIYKVVHGYRTADDYNKAPDDDLNSSGACNYDVDCFMESIENLKGVNKKAVGLIITNNSSFCSGALINNTNNDGTPYFLTADHCYSNPSQWSFRFNWISPNPVCADVQPSTTNAPDYYQTVSGAALRARRSASDFCLVEITASLPDAWDLVWAGWDRSDAVPASTFGIHHPAGDIMKACRDLNSPQLINSGGESMWRIQDWDLGVTEGGSSGSPLFDNSGRIIGQLSGGTAACNGTVDNGGYDEYGRFATSWSAGLSSSQRLKEWLDPTNTNALTLNSYPAQQLNNFDVKIQVATVVADGCSESATSQVRIINTGQQNITGVQLQYVLNSAAPETIDWTGNLVSGESQLVNLPLLQGAPGNNELTVNANLPLGITDGDTENNTVTSSFTVRKYEITNVIFNLFTDYFGYETSWELADEGGNILYSGSGYNSFEDVSETFVLAAEGCYTFTIYDEYEDGICCDGGQGFYSLSTASGSLIGQGASFGESESVSFRLVDNLSVENRSQKIANIFPNPSTGIFNVNVNEPVNYQLYNILGQQISSGSFTAGENRLYMSSSAKGVYILSITGVNGKTANIRLVKE
ncbi:T9SS type A sorting domain-containing protein [Flavobacterium sp. MK4S-17]|uniref:T9SS type A sorting domain-containing protein n=1 Tax=Flavobacterium sp. MK4S-17 TaxID=2543737 RepID=UPI00135BC733|nr:T9SS type A sorting domain-containing protein [Flavobacterium sp. MK4S-17]